MTKSPHKLIVASRVRGAAVYNAAGEKIGHIEDLSIDKVSGQVLYGLVSFGGFLGLGDRLHPVPWSSLNYDPIKDGYVAPLDRAALSAAPHYTREELTAFGGEDERMLSSMFEYYAQFPPPLI
jgi:sporulation protein YlmC with PRC-barrel domain